MSHYGISRPQLIAAVGCASSIEAAARLLGYSDHRALQRRLRDEGLRVVRVCPSGAQAYVRVEEVRS